MFKLEAFVEDRKLGEALRALAGIARGQPTVVPMVNVEENPAAKKLVAKTGGSTLEMFERHLLERKVEQLRPDDVRAFLKSHGRDPSGYGHLIGLAIKTRLVRRTGSSHTVTYHVVKRLAHG